MALHAFHRAGLKPAELTDQHMSAAKMEANFVLSEMANRQPQLFVSEEYTITSVSGTNTYLLPERALDLLIVLYRITSGSLANDTTLSPLSTTDYYGVNQKGQTGRPTSFWYDRQVTPKLIMWPTPDDTVATIVVRMTARIEDAVIGGGSSMAIPFRYFEAFCAMLAARLAVLYAPERADPLYKLAEKSFTLASVEDQEQVNIRPQPMFGGYFR
jgi:hypothetical protein